MVVLALVFRTEEQELQHDNHCLLVPTAKDKDGGNPARKASCHGAEEVGIAFRFHRNWARLPRVGEACLDWAPLSSTILSDAAYCARSIHDSRR